MDTRWIQDFVTLADVRNFTRAAEIRNLSQAAFSRRIQALEHWMGAGLIDRSASPLKLTGEGERFRSVAVALLSQIADARSQIGGAASRDQVRLAVPYALATTRLPQWWQQWAPDASLSCAVEVGNVHDTVSAFTAGVVDLLICYHHAAHTVQLDASRFERREVDVEKVRPYASADLVEQGRANLPGETLRPVPLLAYSPDAYFHAVVESAIEGAGKPLFAFRAIEAGMSDLLGEFAVRGLGVAWLPDSSFSEGRLAGLVPLGEGAWDVEVSVVAYRNRNNARRAVEQVWRRIAACE
jgi:LysR family transcriptional regulator, hypochlorite-specific transcription factor HypT